MYKFSYDDELNILEIEGSNKSLYGKIYLNDGASLQELTLNGHNLIQDLAPLGYDTTYASAILFPFANRVNNGKYSFDRKDFQLETNQKEENNALHGLIYNKTFAIIDKNTSEDSASVTFEYIENNKSIGFPFTYSIQLKYTFTKSILSIDVTVKNTDSTPFPFTLGWHPYFISKNLYESSLKFNATQQVEIGDRNITTGIKNISPIETFQIKGQQLDDCWVLKSNQVKFETPEYEFTIWSSAENNFLQAYTPPKENAIAIEPTTGVSDSFNNKIGLQTLNPNTTYNITWKLNIANN